MTISNRRQPTCLGAFSLSSCDSVSTSFLLLLFAYPGLTPLNTTFFTVISPPTWWEAEGNFSFAKALWACYPKIRSGSECPSDANQPQCFQQGLSAARGGDGWEWKAEGAAPQGTRFIPHTSSRSQSRVLSAFWPNWTSERCSRQPVNVVVLIFY